MINIISNSQQMVSKHNIYRCAAEEAHSETAETAAASYQTQFQVKASSLSFFLQDFPIFL